jgi:hypothetical protein
VIAQDLANRNVRILAESAERLENRHVRFARAVLLDALSTGDARPARGTSRGHEGIDQRALSDARFAADQSDPPAALFGRREPFAQPCELHLPPHERPVGCGWAVAQPLPWRPRPFDRGCDTNVGLHHRRDEPVATAVDSLDEPRRPRSIANRCADLAHGGRQNRLAD